jgi:hypothetical protein
MTEFEMTSTSWMTDNPLIASVSGSAGNATVTANAVGQTKIHASNLHSTNSIAIDVKVGALYEWEDDLAVYISAEHDVVAMVKGEKKTIGAALVNSTLSGGFSFLRTGSPVITISGTYSGTCLIEANEAGVSEITVMNSAAAASKEILVVVANTREELEGFKYLTTAQNLVTVGESLNVSVSVSIRNNASPVLSGYHWDSSDPSVVQVVSSGSMAVFYGKKTGTVKVTVTNDLCTYPLEIIANCVDPVAAANNPYIMSPNIVTLTVGAANTTLKAELIGGKASDNSGFSWQLADTSVASLYASNETAQIKANREGVTQIVIRHPKAGGIDRTVLVICEPKRAEDCYITTAESIIRMSPSAPAKTLTAALVNGSANDAYNFKWWADSYDIIELNYTGASAVITPIASGTTTIHISHPKAAYQKDIILYVSQYSEFKFDKTSLSIEEGKQSFVNMRVPVMNVATRISYASKTQSGENASAIATASGTNNVCIIDAHGSGTAVITASLVAVSSGITQAAAELLVNVTPSTTPAAYINYTGPTILTIEKGVTKTLSATLAGHGAVDSDSASIQWKAGFSGGENASSMLTVVPSPSQSGVSVNREIQVTPKVAGKEFTVTISHEKAASNVIVYCIVPGENAASITLDRSVINMIYGEAPATLNAQITNGQQNDYEKLKWTVEQSGEIIQTSGSGKKINILAKAVGKATVTATVPSSGKTASCEINIEEQRSITFEYPQLSMYPMESKVIRYTVTPASETGLINWVAGDNKYVSFIDDHNGNLTVITKDTEGVTTITGTTASRASASLTIRNYWGNTLVVDKKSLRTIPVDYNDGTFEAKYEVKPAVSHVKVQITDDTKLRLKAGTYASYDAPSKTYTIASHASKDPESGTAKGTIRFEPFRRDQHPCRRLCPQSFRH